MNCNIGTIGDIDPMEFANPESTPGKGPRGGSDNPPTAEEIEAAAGSDEDADEEENEDD